MSIHYEGMSEERTRCPICDVPMGEYCCMQCGLTWDQIDDVEEEESILGTQSTITKGGRVSKYK